MRALAGDVVSDGLVGGHASAPPTITRQRHREHITACCAAVEAFLARPHSVDMAAEELRLAVRQLGLITGAVDVEQLLDVIFSDFCIGK